MRLLGMLSNSDEGQSVFENRDGRELPLLLRMDESGVILKHPPAVIRESKASEEDELEAVPVHEILHPDDGSATATHLIVI